MKQERGGLLGGTAAKIDFPVRIGFPPYGGGVDHSGTGNGKWPSGSAGRPGRPGPGSGRGGRPSSAGGSPRTYLMLNKPRGYVTTLSDEKGRKTVAALVSGCGKRVWPVGRLDLDSEGFLLMTDDGELTNSLLHPSHQVEKEYLVWVTGDVETALPILSGPMELDGEPLAPAKVTRGRESGGVTQLSITIIRGKPPGAADVRPGGTGGHTAQTYPRGTGVPGPEAQAGTVAAADRPGTGGSAEAFVISWENAGKFLQDSSADLQKWLAFFLGTVMIEDGNFAVSRHPFQENSLVGRQERGRQSGERDRRLLPCRKGPTLSGDEGL